MPDIDSVVTLCDALSLRKKELTDTLLSGVAADRVEDVFTQAGTEDFLKGTVTSLDAAFDGELNAFLGALESNAFMGAFQTQYMLRQRSRMSRWLAIYDTYRQFAAEEGLINRQLKGVGTKVDAHYLTQMNELMAADPE